MEVVIESPKLEISFETEKIYPKLENLLVTPSHKEQKFKSSKYGYNEVIVEAVETEELNIIPTTEEQVKEGMFNKVTVEAIQTEEKSVELDFSNSDINEVIPTEGSYLKKVIINKDVNKVPENIAKDVVIDGVVGELEGGGDYNAVIGNIVYGNNNISTINASITEVSESILTNLTTGYNLFYNCKSLVKIPPINLDNVKNMQGAFYGCSSIEEMPQLDFTTVENMQGTFGNCTEITTVSLKNTHNVTNMRTTFFGCTSLTDVLEINTEKVNSMLQMFDSCGKLKNVNELNAGSVNNISSVFSSCQSLENFGGFKDLGKAYTSKTANYSNYKLNLSNQIKLTYESLMNVINKLYDLNLTYDVANGGTLYTQTLILNASRKALLTAEEIAIATNKGWTVS